MSVAVNPLQIHNRAANQGMTSPSSPRRSVIMQVLQPEDDAPEVGPACSTFWTAVFKSLLRFLLRLSVDYNTLAVLMSLCLFVAVQGSIVNSEAAVVGRSQVPVELVAAALLLFLSVLTIVVEVFQAVTYAVWHHAARKRYRSDKVLSRVITRTARAVSVSAQQRVVRLSAATAARAQEVTTAARDKVRRVSLSRPAASVLAGAQRGGRRVAISRRKEG